MSDSQTKINNQIADIVKRKNVLPVHVVDTLLKTCNARGQNLGQTLVRNHQIKMTDFAQIMSVVKLENTKVKAPNIKNDETKTFGGGIVDQNLNGKTFGEYQIIEEIARGGMGIVYKAKEKSGRIVALKILLTGNMANEAQIKRFIREAQTTAQLQHINIVPIFSTGKINNYHFLTMKYIEGTTFKDIMESDRSLKDKITIFAKVCSALEHAHKKNIIHRDIKPSNVLVDHNEEPYLTDFGLAKSLDSNSALTQTGTTIGTPYYMAPEQVKGEKSKIGKKSDLYSMGVMFYQMLTGQLPFETDQLNILYHKILTEEPVSPRKFDKNLSASLENICLKSMAKNQKDRYSSMTDFIKDIQNYQRGKKVTFSKIKRVKRFYKQHKKKVSFALFLFIPLLVMLLLSHHFYFSFGKNKKIRQASAKLTILKARKLFEKDYVQATLLLEKVFKKNKDIYEVSLELGKFYQKQERFQKARKAFERSIKIAPNDEDTLYYKSLFHLQQKELSLAFSLINKYLKHGKNVARGLRVKSEILLAQGKKNEATLLLQKANELEDKKAKKLFDKIRFGETKLVGIDDFLKIHPNYDKAYHYRANILKKQGKLQQALRDITRAIELNPLYKYFFLKGQWLYQNHFYRQAYEVFSKAYKKSSEKNKENILLYLAQIHSQLKNFSQAYKAYNEILKNATTPQKQSQVTLKLCKLAYKQDDFQRAGNHINSLKKWKKYLTKRNRGEILFYKGLISKKRKQESLAIKYLEKSIRYTYPDINYAYLKLGEQYYKQKAYKKSIMYLKKAIEAKLTNTHIYWLVATACYEIKDYKSALNYINKCVDAEPWKSSFYFLRGNIYSAFGKSQEAEKDYFFSLKLNPNDITPFFSILDNTFTEGLPIDFQKIQLVLNNLDTFVLQPETKDLFYEEQNNLSNQCIEIFFETKKAKIQNVRRISDLTKEKIFLQTYISSNSSGVHRMIFGVLALKYYDKNLRNLIRTELKKKKYTKSIKRRLRLLKTEMETRYLKDRKIEYRQLLVRYYNGRDENALIAMFNGGEDSVGSLSVMLEDKAEDIIIRYFCALALRDLRTLPAREALLEKFQSSDPIVKILSAIALNSSEIYWNEDVFIKNPYVRYLLLKNIPIKHKEYIETFLSDSDYRVKIMAASRLRIFGNRKAEDILISYFTHKSSVIRAFAFYHYWDFSSLRRRNPPLTQMGFGTFRKTRAYIAEHFVPRLKKIGYNVKDSDIEIVITKKGFEWLLIDKKNKKKYFGMKIFRILGQKVQIYNCGEAYLRIEKRALENVSYLIRAIKDKNPEVKRIALSKLILLGDKENVKYIKPLMYDSDFLTRFLAITSMTTYDSLSVQPIMLDSKEPLFIRCSVILGAVAAQMDRQEIYKWMSMASKIAKDPNEKIRLLVSSFVERLLLLKWYGGYKKLQPVLVRYTKEKDHIVRLGRIIALISFAQSRDTTQRSGEKLYNILSICTKDPNPLVQSIAIFGATMVGEYYRIPSYQKLFKKFAQGSLRVRKACSLGYVRLCNLTLSYDVSAADYKWNWEKMQEDFISILVEHVVRIPEIPRKRVLHEVESRAVLSRYLSRALKLYDEQENIWLQAGVIYYLREKYQKALASVQKALKLNPKFTLAYIWVAKIYYKSKQYKKALKALDIAISKSPWHYELCKLRFETLKILGQNEKAQLAEQRLKLIKKR